MLERLNKGFFVWQLTDEFCCEFALPQRIFTIVQLSFSIRSNVLHHYLQSFQIKNPMKILIFSMICSSSREMIPLLSRRESCVRESCLCTTIIGVSYSQIKSFHRKNERTNMKRCVTNSSFTFVNCTIL